MTAATASARPITVARRSSALQATIGWFGAIVAYAGLEHGVGEMLQGWREPDGLFIESWPNVVAFEIVSGEPALTVVPNLFMAGALTAVVSLALAAWAIWFVGRPLGWLGLGVLSVVLLLVGGGLAPPVMGVILAVAAWRLHAERRPLGSGGRRLGKSWRWLVGIGVAAYLGLVPGLVLASLVISVPELLVYALGVTAFGSLILALVAARFDDRSEPAAPAD